MTSNHIAWYNMMETKRHNEAMEMQNLGSLQENRRHNVAVETETHRSNVVYEHVALRNATVNERNATVNERNATVNERNAAVNERNAATNEMNAATNRYNASLRAAELTESITHNRAMEEAKRQELAISSFEAKTEARRTHSQILLNTSNTALNDAKRGEAEANAALRSVEIQLKGKELNNADDYYEDRHTGQVISNIREAVGVVTDVTNLGARWFGLYKSMSR